MEIQNPIFKVGSLTEGNHTANAFVKDGGQSTEFLMADGSTTSGSGNLQKEVTTTTYTITDADNGYTIWFNNPTIVTVAINTLTLDSFECEFYNEGAGTVGFVDGTATVGYPDGTSLTTDKVAALLRKLSTTTYKLKGELV